MISRFWSEICGAEWKMKSRSRRQKEKSLLTHISKCIQQGERKTKTRRRMIRSASRNRSRRYRILIFMRLLQSPTMQPWTQARRFNFKISVSDGYCGHSTDFTFVTIGREEFNLIMMTPDSVFVRLSVRDSRDERVTEPTQTSRLWYAREKK